MENGMKQRFQALQHDILTVFDAFILLFCHKLLIL
jgi:hypothetical protein